MTGHAPEFTGPSPFDVGAVSLWVQHILVGALTARSGEHEVIRDFAEDLTNGIDRKSMKHHLQYTRTRAEPTNTS
jgi:hypothetical protein